MIGQMFQIKTQKIKIRRIQQNQSVGMMEQVKKILGDVDQRLIVMVRS